MDQYPVVADDHGSAEGLSLGWQILVFILLLAVVFSRRPTDILHAQFYAEDGKRWFAQAYNDHWLHSLEIPDASYLQILPRLIAGITLLFPFRWAPLIMNLAGAIVQVLPVTALLSRRCAGWGTLRTRILMSALYIADPNASEIHVNLTNAQWHLALLQVLLAFSDVPRTWLGKLSDCVLFLVGAFSGPFGICLLPLVLVFWWIRRWGWSLFLAGCLAVGALFQVPFILHGTRMPLPLGAHVTLFLRIVGSNVILNAIVGQRLTGHLPLVFLCGAAIFGLVIVLAGLKLAPLSYRLFAVYATFWFLASLKSPMIAGPTTRWDALLNDPGGRYYFFPTMVFLWAALYCAMRAPVKGFRVAGCAVLLCSVLGIVRRWEYAPFPDRHFAFYAKQLELAKPGQHIVIPIYPEWTMELVKH